MEPLVDRWYSMRYRITRRPAVLAGVLISPSLQDVNRALVLLLPASRLEMARLPEKLLSWLSNVPMICLTVMASQSSRLATERLIASIASYETGRFLASCQLAKCSAEYIWLRLDRSRKLFTESTYISVFETLRRKE